MRRFDAPWHFHPELELTLIVQGNGRRFVGDSIEPFATGDLVLLGPNLPHFWYTEGQPTRRAGSHSVVVQFRREFLGAEFLELPELGPLRRLIARAGRGLHFSGAPAAVAALRLRRLVGRDGPAALLELLEILCLLAQAPGARPLTGAAYEPNLDRHAELRLARVYGFLMRNFRDDLSLARIARVAAMNPSAFSRYFKRSTRRNVTDLINELRVDHAGQLLRETASGIAHIAVDSGFATLSSFNRRFRERMNCTPRDYRKIFSQDGTAPAPPSSSLRWFRDPAMTAPVPLATALSSRIPAWI